MRIDKSIQMNGWIGFFTKDENNYPEEFLSVEDLNTAQQIVDKLQRDIDRLKLADKTGRDGE